MNVSKEKRLYLKDKLQGWPDAMCLTSRDIADLISLIESSGEKEGVPAVEYKLRPEVAAFAMLMEAELRKHDDRPGWKNERLTWLSDRLDDEFGELSGAIEDQLGVEKISQEAADVANFAMMIADVSGGLKPAPSPGPATERKEGHKALKYDKATRTIKTFDPNPAPLPAEVEEAMAELEELAEAAELAMREANKDGAEWEVKKYWDCSQAALAAIRAALTKPPLTVAPPIRVTREQIGDACREIFTWNVSMGTLSGLLEKWLRELGIAVDGEEKP